MRSPDQFPSLNPLSSRGIKSVQETVSGVFIYLLRLGCVLSTAGFLSPISGFVRCFGTAIKEIRRWVVRLLRCPPCRRPRVCGPFVHLGGSCPVVQGNSVSLGADSLLTPSQPVYFRPRRRSELKTCPPLPPDQMSLLG